MQFKEDEGGISSKHFLKLKDKESITGVFRGDPYDFRQHWVNKKSQVCVGDGCPLCVDNKSSFRFRINFITKENEEYVAKVLEQGWTVYEQLREMHRSDYNLEKTIVRITRNGVEKQTTYLIMPRPDGAVKPELEKILGKVELHDLKTIGNEKAKDTPQVKPDADEDSRTPYMSDEDLPF